MELPTVAPPAGDVVAVPPPVFFTVVAVDTTVVEVPGRTGPLGSVVTTGSTTPPPEPPDPASAGEVVEVAPDTVVVEPDTVVVVDGTVVVVDGAVVVVAFAVHTAYRVSPPPGIVIDWLFEYDVPVPADVVSHRDNTYPVREKPEPLLRVTVVPDTPVVAEIDPVPPFEL